MNADERAEIAASVAAHAELGSRYDGAVAEGLVERIGEEIDRRVDARLRDLDRQGSPGPRRRPSAPASYSDIPAYQAPASPAPAPAATAPPVPPPARRGNGVTGMFLGLGSIGLAVGATAAVVSHHPAAVAEVLMVVLIWLAIMVINIAHSQRR